MIDQNLNCPMCRNQLVDLAFRYDRRPDGETPFDFGGLPYQRDILRCSICSHYLSVHDLNLSDLYQGTYMDTTYSGDKLREDFDRIMSLPPEASDNVDRVKRVMKTLGRRDQRRTLLDIGSGLGVFCARMQESGWQCTALDPDKRSVTHAREYIGVDALQADYLTAEISDKYDLISFNKVLEHVEDPLKMLHRAIRNVKPDGWIYIELPDGESAQGVGFDREEFFIEHIHIFSMSSLSILVNRAGFIAKHIFRLQEPSSKFTLAAFLQVV